MLWEDCCYRSGKSGFFCLLYASLILCLRMSNTNLVTDFWLSFMCAYIHKCECWYASLCMHCGNQRTSSAVGPCLPPYFETGPYCFSVTRTILSGLWASRNCPVFIFHFTIATRSLQTWALLIQLFCMSWRSELRVT